MFKRVEQIINDTEHGNPDLLELPPSILTNFKMKKEITVSFDTAVFLGNSEPVTPPLTLLTLLDKAKEENKPKPEKLVKVKESKRCVIL